MYNLKFLDEETFIEKAWVTLSSDPFFKEFFKDVDCAAYFFTVLFGQDITTDMISYDNTENISSGGMTKRHDVFITIHFPKEDKIIHINMEMQNQYYTMLSERIEDDLHLGKSLKLNNRKQSKKIAFYSIWFLSPQCASHYRFKKFIKCCTIRAEDGSPLTNKDFIYLISLQKMKKCSIIQLRELAILFLNKNIKNLAFDDS